MQSTFKKNAQNVDKGHCKQGYKTNLWLKAEIQATQIKENNHHHQQKQNVDQID